MPKHIKEEKEWVEVKSGYKKLKTFAIEYRAIDRDNKYHMPKNWTVHSRYLTDKDREKALRNLQGKSFYGMKLFEYRNAS